MDKYDKNMKLIVRKKHSDSKQIKQPANLLPPCRVCLQDASGIHYGVNTCEACKSFFRRSLKNAPADCLENGLCDITSGKLRSTCTACRFQKCLHVGMSKERIKTGRYTTEQRRAHVEEVKMLRRMNCDHSVTFLSNQTQHTNGFNTTAMRNKNVENELNESQLSRLCEAYTKIYENSFKMFAEMTKEEKEAYRKTRVTKRVSKCFSMFERELRDCITFAKLIPGFTSLIVEDQVSLVKENRIEFRLLSERPEVSENDKKSIYIRQARMSFPRTHLVDYYASEDIVTNVYDTCTSIVKIFSIYKDNRPMALTCAIAILAADRCETIKNHKEIDSVVTMIINTLKTLVGNIQVARIFTLLADLRRISDYTKNLEHSLVVTKEVEDEFPTLLKETWYSNNSSGNLIYHKDKTLETTVKAESNNILNGHTNTHDNQPDLSNGNYSEPVECTQSRENSAMKKIPLNIFTELAKLQEISRQLQRENNFDSINAKNIVEALAQLPDLHHLDSCLYNNNN